jgi:hypothetical protein
VHPLAVFRQNLRCVPATPCGRAIRPEYPQPRKTPRRSARIRPRWCQHHRPGARQMPLAPPVHEAAHLVGGVEALAFDQAFAQAQGHGSVVDPLAGLESERPPSTMSAMGSKVPGGLNSNVVPRASPTARPSRHPRNRSISRFVFMPRSFAACGNSAGNPPGHRFLAGRSCETPTGAPAAPRGPGPPRRRCAIPR